VRKEVLQQRAKALKKLGGIFQVSKISSTFFLGRRGGGGGGTLLAMLVFACKIVFDSK
jgi:hypothetical protein